jgi:hypothetical protein
MMATAAKTFLSKTLCVILAITVVFAFMPQPAMATSKGVNKQTFSTSTSAVHKKAAAVKKGTTKLTIKKGEGYIKFKATAAKTYSFKFSKVKSKKFSSCAYMSLYTPSSYKSSILAIKKMATKGGKYSMLWLSANGYKHSGKLLYRPLASRTGKVKLKKDQWVYFYIGNKNGGKTTAMLTIA